MSTRAVAVTVASALAFALSGAARADDDPAKAVCVKAYDSAQKQRLAGDLPAAKAELLVCSREACPAIVRTDCVGWLREVEAAMPSIIVTVRDRSAADVRGARVFIDSDPEHARATGEALELKPGPQKLRVEVPGSPMITREIVVSPGEKNRIVALVVGGPMNDDGEALAPKRTPVPRASWVVGTIGAVFVASGVTIDIAGTVHLHDLRTSCAPNCGPSSVDATRAEIIAGDAILGAGVLLVGTAAIYYLLRKGGNSREARIFAEPLTVSF